MGCLKLSYYDKGIALEVNPIFIERDLEKNAHEEKKWVKGYRYGFQGQERDNEWKGEGNSIAYEARIYDPRLGKFLSVDPWTDKYAWQTPYAYHRNSRPIAYIDWNGYGDPPSWGEGFLVSSLKGIGGFYSYINNNPAHAGYSLRSNKITEQQIQAYSINWSQQLDPYYQINSYAAGAVGMFKGFGQFWIGAYRGDGAMSAQAMPDVVSMILLAYSGYRLSVPKPRLSNPVNFVEKIPIRRRDLIKNKLPVSTEGKLLGEISEGNFKMKGKVVASGEFDYVVTAEGRVLLGRKHTYLSGGLMYKQQVH